MNMKITNYRKRRNNTYEITLDNYNKFNLYDDVILKYNLLVNKELEEIMLFNSYVEAYNKALRFISSKLRTEKEIINKLKNYSNEATTYTLDRLKKDGYLDDILYIKSYIKVLKKYCLI